MSTIKYSVAPSGPGWVVTADINYIEVRAHFDGSREEAVEAFARPFRAKGIKVEEAQR